jgi:hypothetical protein
MFPDPVDPLRCFVAQITGVEVSAKKQNQLDVFAMLRPQLANLGRFLFAALVRVREIAGRLGLDEERDRDGRSRFGWMTASIGILTRFGSSPTRTLTRKANVPGSISVNRRPAASGCIR